MQPAAPIKFTRVKSRLFSVICGTSVLLAASAGLVGAPAAHADTVSACSGVQLPRSAVTDIMNQVLVPVLSPVESLLSSLTLGTVNLGLSNTLSSAASGAPIGLGAVNINGGTVDVLTNPNCQSQADGFTLAVPQGLSIGGNSISGLGQTGLAATAGALDSIAIGDLASTSLGANGAIAIGAGATASHAGSIALGAGSVANGSTLGNSAYMVGGTAAAELNVGARRITGVSAGANATDAVNVAQLTAVNGNVTQLGYEVAALDGLAVKYVDGTHAAVSFGGTGGTRLTNVAAGTVSATSNDAVNGAQLHATNNTVTQLSYDVGALDGVAVKYTDSTHTAIQLGGSGGTRIANVAAGVAATDAVNVAQLNAAVSVSVGAVRDDALLYNHTTNSYDATRGGTEQKITGVAAGTVSATSTDAVNGSQLAATNAAVTNVSVRAEAAATSVAQHLGGGSTVQVDGSVSAPSYTLVNVAANGSTSNTTYNNVGDALDGLGNSIANVSLRVEAAVATSQRTVAYDSDARDAVTFTGPNGTRLSNVAQGSVSATSTDAVNGAQLYATNTIVNQLASGTAGYMQVNNTAAYATPVTSGANSLAAGAGAMASGEQSMAIGTNAQALAANSVALGQAALADRANSVSIGSAGAERQLTNLAAGTASTDGVNLGQLQSGMGEAVSSANAYTDRRLAQMDWDIGSLRKDANAGTAAAMAMASIPTPIKAGQGMVGFGMSGWQGQHAFAMGLSRASDNGRFIMRASATYNSRSQGGANVGVGFGF